MVLAPDDLIRVTRAVTYDIARLTS
jgi:hypothetical protein